MFVPILRSIFENADAIGVQAIIATAIKIRLFFNNVTVSKSFNAFPLRQNIPLRTAFITDIFYNLKSTQPKYTTIKRYTFEIIGSFLRALPKTSFSKAINTKK